MTPSERRPALLLLAVGVLLGLLGLVLPDERYAVLCWIVAVPTALGGLIPIAWGNARGEIERRLPSRD